jgi:hypothetical protein
LHVGHQVCLQQWFCPPTCLATHSLSLLTALADCCRMLQVRTPQPAQLRRSPRQERQQQLAGRVPAAAAVQCWTRRAAAGKSDGTRTRTLVHAGQAAARATLGTR